MPQEGEAQDAYAFMQITDSREEEPRFSGWMIASSPALIAMDHPRYDIWVSDCLREDGTPDAASDTVEIPDAPDAEPLPGD